MAKAMKKKKKNNGIISCLVLSILFATHVVMCMGAYLSGREGDVMRMEVKVEMEMEMESETSRRVLWATTAQKRYISYGALNGDVVPCSRPGAPYYNCRALPSANPYTRGCGIITGCARDMNP